MQCRGGTGRPAMTSVAGIIGAAEDRSLPLFSAAVGANRSSLLRLLYRTVLYS